MAVGLIVLGAHRVERPVDRSLHRVDVVLLPEVVSGPQEVPLVFPLAAPSIPSVVVGTLPHVTEHELVLVSVDPFTHLAALIGRHAAVLRLVVLASFHRVLREVLGRLVHLGHLRLSRLRRRPSLHARSTHLVGLR